ncbi:hypothetical protein QZH41_000060 [Actinostola sp. cb2023]|nr:hypothetical protein QZH41_000060 [Actinostola sp. cb2023]
MAASLNTDVPKFEGVRFDPDVAQTLRLEFAKSNTKVSKPTNKHSVLTTGMSYREPIMTPDYIGTSFFPIHEPNLGYQADGQEIKDTFEFEVDEDGSEVVSTAILFNKFEAHCKPRKNLVVDRHRFLTRDQASDTGAEVNVIPYSAYRKIAETSKIDLRKPKARLSAYNGEDIPVKAVCTLQSKHKGITRNLEFFITSIESEPVLSISACKELGLIKFISAVDRDENTETFAARIREEYKDVFTGIGCLERPYHIVLDPEVQPVINPPRRVPYGLQDRVKAALDEMCNQGIIVPVDQPTDWVNSMVAVEKKNTDKLRICIDPRPLNKAIKREHYHLPTIEEITTRLSGAKFFSTLDARSGFWQIPLDDESSTLTTFATPYGRYRFTRMPFGIHSAQEVFHKRLHELFQDLSGVETDIDDILVWGRTREGTRRKARENATESKREQSEAQPRQV